MLKRDLCRANRGGRLFVNSFRKLSPMENRCGRSERVTDPRGKSGLRVLCEEETRVTS